jgi:RimJ/RimL family protein N-acetyltransferase
MTATLQTDRLILRPWHDDDLAPFAELNADPVVMEHFPAPMTREESDAFAGRIRSFMAERGWGLWAVTAPEQNFLGFVGLSIPRFEAPFTPCVEIGWRLSTRAWGHHPARTTPISLRTV